jgi:hypothetical protein
MVVESLHRCAFPEVAVAVDMAVDMELPEIRAWARRELPGYAGGELDGVIREWSSADGTRRELLWFEGALRRRRSCSRRSCDEPSPQAGHQ